MRTSLHGSELKLSGKLTTSQPCFPQQVISQPCFPVYLEDGGFNGPVSDGAFFVPFSSGPASSRSGRPPPWASPASSGATSWWTFCSPHEQLDRLARLSWINFSTATKPTCQVAVTGVWVQGERVLGCEGGETWNAPPGKPAGTVMRTGQKCWEGGVKGKLFWLGVESIHYGKEQGVTFM